MIAQTYPIYFGMLTNNILKLKEHACLQLCRYCHLRSLHYASYIIIAMLTSDYLLLLFLLTKYVRMSLLLVFYLHESII